ncbi:MAG TPA: RimK/LysX family protein [Candidatus Saccharimonadales bacterium]
MAAENRRLKAIVGRAERVDFPDGDIKGVPAKIDTGAFRSALWASSIREENGVLKFTMLGPESPYYSGKECETSAYERVEVENSFGDKEERYSVHIRIRLGTKIVPTNFTLTDRSQKVYPVLIGRKLLRGRYVVDVSEGQPIDDEETNE